MKKIILASAVIAAASAAWAQSLLNEQFSGSGLSSVNWMSATPFSDSGVSVSSGAISLSNGAGILSVASYSTPIEITFSFAFTGGTYDSFRVYTRAGSFNSNGYGAKGVGVSFRIQEDTGNLTGNIALEDNGAVLATGTMALARNTYYTVRLTDTGGSLSVFLNSSTSALLTASTSSSYGNKIASFNREGAGHGSFISAGSVSTLDFLTAGVLVVPVITAISAPRQTVKLGQSLTLSVSASSGTATSYQWKRNGLPISGATVASYSITSAEPLRDSGWYQAVVTTTSSSTTSPVVFVNVAVDPAQALVWGANSEGQGNVPSGLNGIAGFAAGSGHNLVLKPDGTVVAWGYNVNGETQVPSGLSNVVGVAAANSSIALKSDGTLVAWGYNGHGEASVPAGLSNVVAVSASEHVLALKADGTVVAWGRNSEGQTSIPAGLNSVIRISAGNYHSLALKADGTVVAWGSNSFGQSTVPAGLGGVKDIAAGSLHSVVLKADGSVVDFGAYDEKGPSAVSLGVRKVVALANSGGGTTFGLALRADGSVAAWGTNRSGQTLVPATATQVLGLAAGGHFAVALRDSKADLIPTISAHPVAQSANLGQKITFAVTAGAGTAPVAYQWRKNGVLIPGATSVTYVIDQVSPSSGGNYDVVVKNYLGTVTSLSATLAFPAPVITAISAPRQTVNLGQSLTLSVSATSSTAISYQWKRNGLPISGATAANYTFTSAEPLRDNGWYQAVVSNSSGFATSAVVFVNVVVDPVQVVAWGSNAFGQTNVPAKLGGIVAISAGGDGHTVALKSDGAVVSWGDNRFGQTNVPNGLSEVAAVVAGHAYTVALKAGGTVVAWGSNVEGQTNVPAGLSGVTSIAAGVHHTLALKNDGTVVEWGGNFYGQQAIPPGLRGVIAVAAGFYHTVALKSDGTVVAWGDNRYGAAAVPAGLTAVVAIACGGLHSLALKNDGTVVAWGAGKTTTGVNEEWGQAIVPAGLNGVTAIVGGGGFSVALKNDGTVVAWGGNGNGQTTLPVGLSRVTAIAAAVYHTVVLVDWASSVAPAVALQPASLTVIAGGPVSFVVAATGTGPLGYQWRKDGTAIPGATSSTLSLGSASSLSAGPYDVVISNFLATVTSAAAVLSIDPAPLITRQPVGLTVIAGQAASFSVVVTGSPGPTFQWQKNGVNIPGATSATHTVLSTQTADAGSYTCVVTNSAGAVTSSAAVLSILESSRLGNVSVRTTLAGAQTLIVGFVLSGGGKDVLVRAAGPALLQFGLTAAMADPRLELYKESTKILENDNWPGVLTSTFTNLGAFPFLPNSRDAALMQNLNGSYTVLASGGGSGVVLVEAYDAGSGNTARLVNISARNRVGTGPDILFAGFFIAGTGNKRVLIRAVGPTIGGAPFNVPNILVDPKLEVYDANAVKISENDNWDGALAATFSSVGAFALAAGSKDAALIVTLSAGSSFTAQVKGADGGTGEALIEVYELP